MRRPHIDRQHGCALPDWMLDAITDQGDLERDIIAARIRERLGPVGPHLQTSHTEQSSP